MGTYHGGFVAAGVVALGFVVLIAGLFYGAFWQWRFKAGADVLLAGIVGGWTGQAVGLYVAFTVWFGGSTFVVGLFLLASLCFMWATFLCMSLAGVNWLRDSNETAWADKPQRTRNRVAALVKLSLFCACGVLAWLSWSGWGHHLP